MDQTTRYVMMRGHVIVKLELDMVYISSGIGKTLDEGGCGGGSGLNPISNTCATDCTKSGK